MVAAISRVSELDDIDEVNLRWACRLYTMAERCAPIGVFLFLEIKAWMACEGDPFIFCIRFEEYLFSMFPDLHDVLIQEIL
jgi:hypothetical protein